MVLHNECCWNKIKTWRRIDFFYLCVNFLNSAKSESQILSPNKRHFWALEDDKVGDVDRFEHAHSKSQPADV